MLSSLQKFKSFIDSKKIIISLLALVLLIGLFFIPFEAGEPVSIEMDGPTVVFRTSIFNCVLSFDKLISQSAIVFISILLLVYFTSLILTIVIVVISHKKRIFVLSGIAIALLFACFVFYFSTSSFITGSPSFAFYIVVIAVVLYLLYAALALIVKYAKPRPPKDKALRQPKPRKLSTKERIAELERELEELKKSI